MGAEILQHDQKEAERLLAFGLKKCALSESDLLNLKKGDHRKKAIAWLIRKRTAVKTEWITNRLEMGSRSNLSRYIREVETARDGDLWSLKNKMTSKAD